MQGLMFAPETPDESGDQGADVWHGSQQAQRAALAHHRCHEFPAAIGRASTRGERADVRHLVDYAANLSIRVVAKLILQEVAELFPDEFVHVGGDEATVAPVPGGVGVAPGYD
eukprot:Skav224599  [mRNA]  locus=scaffold2684:312574:316864:- [translate_table: standard]